MPTLAFEEGSRAVPVDFRRCREHGCGDGAERRAASTAPTPACRSPPSSTSSTAGPGRRSDPKPRAPTAPASRAGNLYIQYWTYYADSATLRGVPVAGDEGYHRDDWEGVQIRIGPDGSGRRARLLPPRLQLRAAASPTGARTPASARSRTSPKRSAPAPRNGWGPETRLLLVSGGSHAGNAAGIPHVDRFTPGRRVHLIPLEPIAADERRPTFAISPPWRKQVWRDPEAEGTD